MTFNFFKKHTLKRGYTMLFAVLISALVLAMGISILSISRKEVMLSSSNRESIAAFYAADMGMECAIFWDNNSDAFSTSSTKTTEAIWCNGDGIATGDPFPTGYLDTVRIGGGGDSFPTSKFWLDIDHGLGSSIPNYCAIVYVTKSVNTVSHDTVTVIESRGYNTCDVTGDRRVERALKLSPAPIP